MITQHPQNIILFSAGESQENGNFGTVKQRLEAAGHRCHGWRELFETANDSENIALLPMLLKKVPTFDFAIILGDGVDTLKTFRQKTLDPDEDEKAAAAGDVQAQERCRKRIMRDNVLFEAGLCTMALGANRVVMLIEDDIRIPENLHGVGKLDVQHIRYSNPDPSKDIPGDLDAKLDVVLTHIENNAEKVFPIVIGAAISTADGYFNNFVLRFWESIISHGFQPQTSSPGAEAEPQRFALEDIEMRILLPRRISDNTKSAIAAYQKTHGFRKGSISDAGPRGLLFDYFINDAGKLVVCDIPTTVTASYNVVVDILQISADDKADAQAKEHFLLKELDSFHRTLKKLMHPTLLGNKLRGMKRGDGAPIYPEHKLQSLLDCLPRVHLERVDLG